MREDMGAVAFTPGPWSVEDFVSVWSNHSPTAPDGKGYPIVECLPMADWARRRGLSGDLLSLEVRQANARLIAAAPDLYLALENILSWTDEDATQAAAREALAKARGDVREMPNLNHHHGPTPNEH